MVYNLTWITKQIAVGYAPMSYEELDFIKREGVVAIVNLCEEFSDLHEIEEQSGFEVYYLPTTDECAPDMEKMEEALQWLDEALYLKKKVLIHCRHGQGRTGTFLSAYLLRRGLALKYTEKKLKGSRANPTNYSQWKLLKKYSKQQGQLNARPASIENPNTVDLMPFLHDYENLLAKGGSSELDTSICRQPFELQLVEAVHVSHFVNSSFTQAMRHDVLERAVQMSALLNKDAHMENSTDWVCPLFNNGTCLIREQRPLRCRQIEDQKVKIEFEAQIDKFSRDIFFVLTGTFPPEGTMHFTIADTVSGRYVQQYFKVMQDSKGGNR